jgi:hypothetical protein
VVTEARREDRPRHQSSKRSAAPVEVQDSAPRSEHAGVLGLQAAVGNHVVARMLSAPVQRDHGPGLKRVLAATAAKNLTELTNIQRDLLQQMRSDPLNPPQDAREGLATARTWTMDRVAEIYNKVQPEVEKLSGTGGTDQTEARERLEAQLDTDATPYLNVLLAGDPEYRYQHFNTDIEKTVMKVVRLHATRQMVGLVGQGKAAHAEAVAQGGVAQGDEWCGAFAYVQGAKAGGFDPHWRSFTAGEGGIRSALAYGGMDTVWIWVFDHWEGLREYHKRRDAERQYQEITTGPPAMGILPGDIVLKDLDFGTNPEHITTAISFDGRFLRTVGGNEPDVSRSGAYDLTLNPAPNDVRNLGPDGKEIFAENAEGKKIRRADPKKGPKNKRIHGIGRWSTVDYEIHVYKTAPQKPTQPPTLKEVQAAGRPG